MPADILAFGRALVDAGGWAALFALALTIGIGLFRGWWIPGFIGNRDQKRADQCEAENRTLLVTVARLTAELNAARRELRDRVPRGPSDGRP